MLLAVSLVNLASGSGLAPAVMASCGESQFSDHNILPTRFRGKQQCMSDERVCGFREAINFARAGRGQEQMDKLGLLQKVKFHVTFKLNKKKDFFRVMLGIVFFRSFDLKIYLDFSESSTNHICSMSKKVNALFGCSFKLLIKFILFLEIEISECFYNKFRTHEGSRFK